MGGGGSGSFFKTEVYIATGNSLSIEQKSLRICKKLFLSIFKSFKNQSMNKFIITGKNGCEHTIRESPCVIINFYCVMLNSMYMLNNSFL